jgi:transposase
MLSLGSEKEGYPNMKREHRCAAPSSIAALDPTQTLREENERLRAEVAYLKILHALIRSKISAAPTKRV